MQIPLQSDNQNPTIMNQPNRNDLAAFNQARQNYISFNNYRNQVAYRKPSFHIQAPKLWSSKSMAAKTRIKWTEDLHKRFVECVNCLGGPEKATPKLIMRMMGVQGLTIFHIKSHLQKYRVDRYIPESNEGKGGVPNLPSLNSKAGLQSIAETLKLQLDVQRRLHEQLEIQRNLQSRIEEQGRQLKQMLDLQLNRTHSTIINSSFTIRSSE